jgi:hypothetical protein
VTTGAPPLPPGRYGPEQGRGSRWARALVIGGAVAIGLVVVAFLAIGAWRDPVQWTDIGFSVHGAGSMDVTFEVTKDPEATAVCRVQGLSQSYAEVGVQDVEIGPGARTQRVTVTVPTAELAVSGTVDSCELTTD